VVCPSHIPLVQYYRFAKAECLAEAQEKRQAEHARQRHEAKVARLERLEEERKANLRKKKEALTDKPAPARGVASPGAAGGGSGQSLSGVAEAAKPNAAKPDAAEPTLAMAPASQATGTAEEAKKAAIAAALKRAAEKKAALAQQGLGPKNTENLTPAQRRQVDAAEARRRELLATESVSAPQTLDQPPSQPGAVQVVEKDMTGSPPPSGARAASLQSRREQP
jgi:electron transport complex protein RnfC